MKKVWIFDSTLRDGAQAKGISFSLNDKIKIAKALDNMGIDYIEGGNPGSNPKDLEFFEILKKEPLKKAKLVAFGSTRRKNVKVEEDANVQKLLSAGTPTVAIFGKSWDFHVTDIINTTLQQNLEMIKDTVSYFKKRGKEVIFDAEHFFDGFKANEEYALETLKAAEAAGADCICLCETNGGAFPDEVIYATKQAASVVNVPLGIHAHDDTGMAVANSIMAVENGVRHIQGTFIGIGERCGNANLSTIIANLQLKRGYQCLPDEKIKELTSMAYYIAEIANVSLNERMPYVGSSAFTHKGGMHIDGVCKNSSSFEHISPESVGNHRRILLSEVAGRSSIIQKVQRFYPNITKDSPEAQEIVDIVKKMEMEGYQFEGAEATFKLVVMRHLMKYKKPFQVDEFKVIEEKRQNSYVSSSVIRVLVGDKHEFTAAEGDGPVDALDAALRKALEVFYPSIKNIRLTDYKVRVIDSNAATAAKVRVLIESTDGDEFGQQPVFQRILLKQAVLLWRILLNIN